MVLPAGFVLTDVCTHRCSSQEVLPCLGKEGYRSITPTRLCNPPTVTTWTNFCTEILAQV